MDDIQFQKRSLDKLAVILDGVEKLKGALFMIRW